MFQTQTTFLLGAGASYHYGYPTGAKLINLVVDEATDFSIFLEYATRELEIIKFINNQNPKSSEKGFNNTKNILKNYCCDVRDRIERGQPTSIDNFLGFNKDLSLIGRFLVASAILRCERTLANNRREILKYNENNWLKFIVNKIKSAKFFNQTLRANKISFVTFNYDISLETELQIMLSRDSEFPKEEIIEFFEPNRIVHLYGSVARNQNILTNENFIHEVMPVRQSNDPKDLEYMHKHYNESFEASKKIKVINPSDKAESQDNFNIAKDILRNSRSVYILGYGFDETNNSRLDLSNILKSEKTKQIFYTNFGPKRNIDTIASELFCANQLQMIRESNNVTHHENNIIWRSTNTVYKALEDDFRLTSK